MIELEQRLRSALADLADEVPPSTTALAEQRRRQDRAKRPARRRPILATAAAAVVLAIGIIPAAVSRPEPPAAPLSVAPPGSVHLDPAPDGPYLTIADGPFPIGEFTDGGRRWSVLAFLERHPAGTGWEHRACVVAVPPGVAANDPSRHPNSTGCVGLSGEPRTKVRSMAPMGGALPGGGPLPRLLLFATAPEVSRLDVRGGLGEPARVSQLARSADIAMYLAEFDTSSAGFGYTARDSAGTVIETGIS